MIKVSVPATSANLGPGFDSLGIALKLYNVFTFKKASSFSFDGDLNVEDNLIIKTIKKAFAYKNEEEPTLEITSKSDVPMSRGLGSSATCIIAGLLAANYYLANKLSNQEILNLSTEIEGHPDNVTPAFLGGLVASYLTDKTNCVRYEVSNNIKFNYLVPNFTLSTEAARKALPATLTYKQAVNNISRCANIPFAFTKGDLSMLKDLLSDAIHEPFRFPLIEDSLTIKEYATKNNLPFFLSGAGPTLCILDDKYIDLDIETKKDWQVYHLEVDYTGAKVVEIDE